MRTLVFAFGSEWQLICVLQPQSNPRALVEHYAKVGVTTKVIKSNQPASEVLATLRRQHGFQLATWNDDALSEIAAGQHAGELTLAH